MFRDFIDNFDYDCYSSSKEDISSYLKMVSLKNQAFNIGHNVIEALISTGIDRAEACKMLDRAIARRKLMLTNMQHKLEELACSIEINQVD